MRLVAFVSLTKLQMHGRVEFFEHKVSTVYLSVPPPAQLPNQKIADIVSVHSPKWSDC